MPDCTEFLRALDRFELAAMQFADAERRGKTELARQPLVDARAEVLNLLTRAFTLSTELRLAIEATYPSLDNKGAKLIRRRLEAITEQMR